MVLMHSRPRGANITAAAMTASISHRTWSTMDLGREKTCHSFLVESGAAETISHDGLRRAVTGPAVIWFPQSRMGQFRLKAGGHGWTFSAKAGIVTQVMGAAAVGIQLRTLLEASLTVPPERIEERVFELAVSFAALAREANEQTAGGREMIASHLTQILIHMWRASTNLGTDSPVRATNLPTAERFQQLLELHYHEQLRVDDYAEILGVTRAHLHDTCLRILGGTPLSLIHGRMIGEARQRLRYTTLPVEQIAYSLGFRDPGYFNRFFKRLTHETPGAFRHRINREAEPASTSFAAWP